MSNKQLKRCHYIYKKKNEWDEQLSESEQKFLDEHFDEYWNSNWRISEVNSEAMNRNILKGMGYCL